MLISESLLINLSWFSENLLKILKIYSIRELSSKLKLVYEVFMENVYFNLDLNLSVFKKKFYLAVAKYLGLFEVLRKISYEKISSDNGLTIQYA